MHLLCGLGGSLLLVFGCSSTTSGGTGSGGAANSNKPTQACLDTAEALARAAERCGGTYKTEYDTAVKGLDCTNVVQVRDETSLRGTCIPSLGQVACEDLLSGKIDASCKSQLLRKANLPVDLRWYSAFQGISEN